MAELFDEKWLIEESAALALVEILNLQTGVKYQIFKHADRPDIVIENEFDGTRLGVEVTHLFYDADEARFILGRSQKYVHPPEYIEEYIQRLNALLQQKSEKAKGYDHEYPLALLIRVVSPLFHMLNFDEYKSRIIVCTYFGFQGNLVVVL
ncbi:hypothetical protein [Desulfosporosinus fructosivorans]|uniref:hypothetical protein n=1 Tax=Desulfosporosinus fructosivorans TaxID=2018669 RepID=UPI001FB1766C|nr:hypothetical protein [Desulfosporosinus fructosivorans]